MKSLVAFFEIPVVDFERGISFYQKVFGIKMKSMDCGVEKMAFFPKDASGLCPGALSWSSQIEFKPSQQGVLISLQCDNMETTLKTIAENGGAVIIPKTKIEAEGRGYFAVFTDCEGNRIGLYADK